MYFEQVPTPGLGCFSYMVGCPAAGTVAVVDPRRDTDCYVSLAKQNGMRITHIFDTHVHADHVSGARELGEKTGAGIYVHESAQVEFEARKLKGGEEFQFGNALVRALHTPGHTLDSVSFLVSDLARNSAPCCILTGDLLFVGDVGRPDLPGADSMEELALKLYYSLYRVLGELPDYLEVYPGHGQGSLCGQGMSAKPYTTLGYERLANPMLRHGSFEDFKKAALANLPMRPQSFSAIIWKNLGSLPVTQKNGEPGEFALSPEKAAELLERGACLLDLRDALSFSAAHIPGSIHVDASNSAALNWIGAAVPPDCRLVLVLPQNKDFSQMQVELGRIGYDAVEGWLRGGMKAWLDDGREASRMPHVSAQGLQELLTGDNPPAMIDVRGPGEYAGASISGSVNFPLGKIMEGNLPPSSAEKPIVICKSGFRASLAGSLLMKQGFGSVRILSGGIDTWVKRKTAITQEVKP